jgi:hypothetical protein
MAETTKPKSRKGDSGLRVPKALRKAVDTLVNSPLGREILADALVAAAGAAAAALVKHRAGPKQVARAGEAAPDASTQAAAATKDLTQLAAGALAGLMTEAARSVLPASLTGTDDGKTDESGRPPPRRATKRKKSKPRSTASRG